VSERGTVSVEPVFDAADKADEMTVEDRVVVVVVVVVVARRSRRDRE
jgi:hypothetical protein